MGHTLFAPNCAYICAGTASDRGGSMTSGQVGGMEHQVLPSIPPTLTVILTLAAMMVCAYIVHVCTYMYTVL